MKKAIDEYASGDLVDIGCGTKPYARLTHDVVKNHIGLDIEDAFNPQACPDIVGTAYEIPTPEGRFDTALSTAALEHLEDPERSLAETFRVLKPGGHAIYTVPFIYHEHAKPRDFVRYTRFGLQKVFERAGFEVVEVRGLSGFWVTAAIALSYYMVRFDHLIRPVRIFAFLTLIPQGIAWLLEKIDRPKDWAWMHLIVARKPG